MARLRLLLASAMLGTLLLVPATAANAAPPTTNSINVPITGTAGVTQFVGSLDVTRFAVQRGQLVALGTLTGTLTNTVTGAVQNVSQAIAIPITAAAGTCDILHLTLGPLDLNLLGLMVHLDRVVLDITAQQGPGNLLGNLLCAVAGLLDGGGALTGLSGLLNNILALLG